MPNRTFDAGFYRRLYLNPRTRVTTQAEMSRRAAMVGALVGQLELPVVRILDAGCGLGWMRPGLLRAFPRATYTGLEVSEHLCERYNWTCGSIASYRPRVRFDLIVCYDVLQYLPDLSPPTSGRTPRPLPTETRPRQETENAKGVGKTKEVFVLSHPAPRSVAAFSRRVL